MSKSLEREQKSQEQNQMPQPYNVGQLHEAFAIFATYLPFLWIKPVMSTDAKYGLLETAGVSMDTLKRIPWEKQQELKALGWALEEFKGKWYWFLVVPDDPRIVTFQTAEDDEVEAEKIEFTKKLMEQYEASKPKYKVENRWHGK